MKIRKLITLVTASSLCLAMLAGCGDTNTSDETKSSEEGTASGSGESSDIDFSEKVNLVWAIGGAAGKGTAVANQNAIDMIYERSGGAIEIELSADGALGNEASLVQQAMEGSCDIVGAAIGTVSSYSEYLSVFQMPFLVNNYELEAEVLKSDAWKALVDAANEEIGTATIVGATEFGMRGIATIDKPVTCIDDVAGLKVRTGGNPVIDEAMTLIGTNPVSIPFAELYSSLQNKVVDAEEINLTSVSMQKHYEVVKYFTDIGLYPWLSLTLISNDVAESLPDGYYELITECIAEADADYMQNELYNWVGTASEDCENAGLVISELTDRDAWIERMSPLYEEWSAKDPLIADFISAVQAMDK